MWTEIKMVVVVVDIVSFDKMSRTGETKMGLPSSLLILNMIWGGRHFCCNFADEKFAVCFLIVNRNFRLSVSYKHVDTSYGFTSYHH